jgi:hypothetical protein
MRAARRALLLGLVCTAVSLPGPGFWLGTLFLLVDGFLIPTVLGYIVASVRPLGIRQLRLIPEAVAGAAGGGVLSALYLLLSNVRYYFLGGFERLLADRGLTVPRITVGLVLTGLYSDIYLLVSLILASAVGGIVGGVLARRCFSREDATAPRIE